jgi:hypothetical protein
MQHASSRTLTVRAWLLLAAVLVYTLVAVELLAVGRLG